MTFASPEIIAEKIWNYLRLNQPIQKADAIFVLGSNDIRVAQRAVELYNDGYAPFIVFSGGAGRATKNEFEKSEAETFANIASTLGVPKEHIIIEDRSTNTGENILFTQQILQRKQLSVHSLLLVQKPYMERRAYAAFARQWPGMQFTITSPQISFADYVTAEIPRDLVINMMIGDLQRIKEYPKLGYQIPQHIPPDIWNAYEELVALGYNKHLIK